MTFGILVFVICEYHFHFLLIPGVGKQGGDLKAISEVSLTEDIAILVNSSRAIIYASAEENFAEAAGKEARKVAEEMKVILTNDKN